jgi:hypothetical protein
MEMSVGTVDKVIKIAYHRNGVTGTPFSVILFESDKQTMVGIVFDGFDGEDNIAILDVDLLNQGTIEFGLNSWRSEHFKPALLKAIEEWRDAQ